MTYLRNTRVLYLVLLLTTTFLLLLPLSVYAATLTVSEEEGQYVKVQDAIEDAQSGDTVLVNAGVYEESLVVDKDLTLAGEGSVEISAPGDAKGLPVMAIGPTDISVTITGLTFSGGVKAERGSCEDADAGLCPSGLAVRGDASVTVSDSILTDNYLGGLYLR